MLLRIGFFSDTYHPYVSGVVRSMDSFAGSLEALGHRVYTFAPSYPRFEEDSEQVFRLPSMPIRRYPGLRLAIPYGSPRIWGTGPDVDVVHVHSPFAMGHAGALYARRLKVPLVFTVHSIYEEYVRYAPFIGRKMLKAWGDTSKLAVRSYLVSFANSCNAVVAPSQYVAALLQEWGVSVQVEVVPTGVAQGYGSKAVCAPGDGRTAAADACRAQLGIAPDTPLWLSVGRLAPEKSLDFVLDAFARFSRLRGRTSEQPPMLVLVGDGPERPALEQRVADLGLAGRVHLVGSVAGDELPGWYGTADLLVHAGQNETQGLVLAEAITCGLPVLTVTDGGLAESIAPGVSGLLAPREVERFAQEALRYFEDPSLSQRLRAGCLQVAPDLSAPAAARRLLGLYNQVLDETAPVPVEET